MRAPRNSAQPGRRPCTHARALTVRAQVQAPPRPSSKQEQQVAPAPSSRASSTPAQTQQAGNAGGSLWSVMAGTTTFATQMLTHFRSWGDGNSSSEEKAEKVLQQAAQAERSMKQQSAWQHQQAGALHPFLDPVPIWELKHIRKLSSLVALTYKMHLVTPSSMRRRHLLELVSTSWACELPLYEHTKSPEEVGLEGDGMAVSLGVVRELYYASKQGTGPISNIVAVSKDLPFAPVSAAAEATGVGAHATQRSAGAASGRPAQRRPLQQQQQQQQQRGTAPAAPVVPAAPPMVQAMAAIAQAQPLRQAMNPAEIVAAKLAEAAAAASAAAMYPFTSAAGTIYAGLASLPIGSALAARQAASQSQQGLVAPGPRIALPPSVAGVQAATSTSTATPSSAVSKAVAAAAAPAAASGATATQSSPPQPLSPNSTTTPECPSEWFVCDDPSNTTRYFVIQGSDTIDHWRLNLAFDPVMFEDPALGVKVHRGVYEATKVLYERFLPLVYEHLDSSPFSKIGFTGHSIGGSLATLLMLMYRYRGVIPTTAVATVYTFGAPAVFCQGARGDSTVSFDNDDAVMGSAAGTSSSSSGLPSWLLARMGLQEQCIRNVIMHRDIVPRAFTCNYSLVADILKGWAPSFKDHYGLLKFGHKHLYYFVGKMMVLQPDVWHSFVAGDPYHPMLPPGPECYSIVQPGSQGSSSNSGSSKESGCTDGGEPEGRVCTVQEAVCAIMDTPHPLDILADPGAYLEQGSISRYHNPEHYTCALGRCIFLKRREEAESRRLQLSSLPLGGAAGGATGGAMPVERAFGGLGALRHSSSSSSSSDGGSSRQAVADPSRWDSSDYDGVSVVNHNA